MLRIFAISTLLLLSGWAYGASETAIEFSYVNTADEWDATIKKATSEGRYVFVDVYTDWCGYCKMMDRDVFSDQQLGARFNEDFVNVKLDAETEFGEMFAYLYDVTGFPTYLFFDAEENLLGAIEGYNELEAFASQTDNIISSAHRLPELKAKMEAGNASRAERREYAVMIAEADPEAAVAIAREEAGKLTLAEVSDPANVPFMTTFGFPIDGPIWTLVKANAETVSEGLGENGVTRYVGSVYNNALTDAVEGQDVELMELIIAEVLPVYLGGEIAEIPAAAFITRKLYYGNLAQEEAYKKLVEEYAASGGTEGDPDFWYNQAYEVVEQYNAGKMLTMVYPWLDGYLAIHEGDFDALALYAYALGMGGEYGKARQKAEEALSVSVSDDQKAMAQDILDLIDQATDTGE